MDAAILVVKRLDRAKQRLASDFDADQRTAIARALFEDALELCVASDFLTWWVVSDDPGVLAAAAERGLRTLEDAGTGLNDAVMLAVKTVMDAGATSLTVVPADIPLAYSGDLVDLLDTGATSDVVVVPSRRGGGTNGLYLSPPDVVPPQFGPKSFTAHLAVAERTGCRCTILNLDRMAIDIDTIEDVDAYLARPKHADSKTSELLSRLRAS
ncbi:MAG: 2-phospho-L-lactate guanylyltransferase [Actinomycetota bacterium]